MVTGKPKEAIPILARADAHLLSFLKILEEVPIIWPSYSTLLETLKAMSLSIPDRVPEFRGQPNPQEVQPCALERHKQEPADVIKLRQRQKHTNKIHQHFSGCIVSKK